MKKKVILSTGKTVEHERSKKDKNEEKGKLNLYVLFLGLAIRIRNPHNFWTLRK